MIDEERAHHPVSRIARAVGVTAQGYYAWKQRPPSRRRAFDAHLKDKIRQIHSDTDGTYGAPRIHAELADDHDIHVGRKRIARLLRELGLQGVSRRGRKRPRSTSAETPAAPDLVRRKFAADGPDQLWVADITYIPTWEGWLFLAAVMDIYTKRIVGWSMRDDLKADIVIDALGMAATMRKPGPGLVHHSDRGGQYRSLAFGKTLRDSGIMASMGSRGDAYDNAAAESMMATIKTELIHRRRFKTKDEARLALFRYIEGFYNPVRRHSALGYMSPDKYERMLEEAPLAAMG
ncbi:MAG: IS3 family transposase [Actinomycetota bacterium]